MKTRVAGAEHAAYLTEAGRARAPEAERIHGVLARLRAGLGACQRCRRAPATVVVNDLDDARVRCRSCADAEQREPVRALPSHDCADADRLRRFRLAAAQYRPLDESSDARGRLVGYAVRFDDTFRRPDGFDESVCHGAFADAIARGGLVLCVDHDRSRIVARQDDGTLRLREHGVGVWAEADLSGSAAGRALLASAGPATFGCSFGFRERTSRVELTPPPRRGRLLRRLDVTELSLVTRPLTAAYPRAWLARDTMQARDRARGERLEDAAASC